jgi:hypothetical protein
MMSGVCNHVDESHRVGGEGFLERGREVFGIAHGVAGGAKAPGV